MNLIIHETHVPIIELSIRIYWMTLNETRIGRYYRIVYAKTN